MLTTKVVLYFGRMSECGRKQNIVLLNAVRSILELYDII